MDEIKLYFSASTLGFYQEGVHDPLPADAVEITQEKHAEIMQELAGGKVLAATAKGNPTTKDFVLTAAQKKAQAVAQRQEAYRQEADPLFMEYQYDQTPESEQAWRSKVDEIKARYPLHS